MTSLFLGRFATEIANSLQMFPQHPAYTDPTNPASFVRKMYTQSLGKEIPKGLKGQDPVKGVQKIFELSELPNPPTRMMLGKDVTQNIRDWIGQFTKQVEEYAPWSDDLGFD